MVNKAEVEVYIGSKESTLAGPCMIVTLRGVLQEASISIVALNREVEEARKNVMALEQSLVQALENVRGYLEDLPVPAKEEVA